MRIGASGCRLPKTGDATYEATTLHGCLCKSPLFGARGTDWKSIFTLKLSRKKEELQRRDQEAEKSGQGQRAPLRLALYYEYNKFLPCTEFNRHDLRLQ